VRLRIEREGRRVRAVEINERSLAGAASSEHLDAEVLVWNGRIGMLAGLIGESDLYIGYDSAGQHIAAALGVKCIDVFAGFSSPRMLERWRPTGRAETRIVAVDTLRGAANANEVIAEVLRHASKMLRFRPQFRSPPPCFMPHSLQGVGASVLSTVCFTGLSVRRYANIAFKSSSVMFR
jgi:hypothetical protein